jgi:hypothetical protein
VRGGGREHWHDGPHGRRGAGLPRIPEGLDRRGADGGKHYTLHVPKDAPVPQFWSFTVYDNESRCMIDTGSYPDRSSRDDITTNADGSTDLYFGPTSTPGKPCTRVTKAGRKKESGNRQTHGKQCWIIAETSDFPPVEGRNSP